LSQPTAPSDFPPNWGEGATVPSQSEEIKLGQILRHIWFGKSVFLLTLPIGILVAIVFMWILPSKYTAEMIVSPSVSLAGKPTESSGTGSGLLSLISTRSNEDVASPFTQFQELLRSDAVAKSLDEKHNLLQIIYAENWDSEKKAWKQPTGWLASLKAQIKIFLNIPATPPPNYQSLAQQLAKIITITQKQRTSLWTVSAVYTDPVVARDLLVWMHDEADAIVRQTAARRAQANVDYILSTLPTVTVNEQRTALTSLLLQQEFNMMMLHSNTSYSAEMLEPPEIPLVRTSPIPALVLALGVLGALVIGAIAAAVVGKRRIGSA
jgi:LPS O-antigen subunit length determinant protein (WzzB/FepE family)